MDLIERKEFTDFYKQFTPRQYKKGQILIEAEDEPQGLFCLLKGYVRKFSITPEGSELTHVLLKPIAYFPMVWAMNDVANIYTYEAITDVSVGCASRKKILYYMSDKPDIILELLKEQLDDYEETQMRTEYLAYASAYKRVIANLLYLSRHFGERVGRTTLINYRFTHQDIASLVGVTRETASKTLEKLKEKGLLRYANHKLLFENIKRLEKELTVSEAKV
jgi:CRP-like cAMP-binding protein